jgi:hypothetical protein
MQVFTPLHVDAVHNVPVHVFQQLSLKAKWGDLLRKSAFLQPPRQLLHHSVAPSEVHKADAAPSIALRDATRRPSTAPARHSNCERLHTAAQQLQRARPRTSPEQSCAKSIRTQSGTVRALFDKSYMWWHLHSWLRAEQTVVVDGAYWYLRCALSKCCKHTYNHAIMCYVIHAHVRCCKLS